MTGKQEIEAVTGRGRKSPSSLPTNRPDLAGGCVLGCLPKKFPMPFVDVSKLPVAERLPGWYGRYFHSPTMTFAHYDFVRGSSIHEHFHPREEVYEVIEGELEFAPSYQRATILQVSLATGGLALGLTAAWRLRDPWVAVGAALLGASIPFTLIIVFPTNKQLLDPTLDSRSPLATSLLRLWNRLHAIRSLLSATAFGVLLSRAPMH